jgi:peroxiredoxin
MALTYSPEGTLGSTCPDFVLKSVEGKSFGLADFRAATALWVMFICNHCPYVKAIEDRVLALAHEYQKKGVAVVGICSNDPTDHPEDSAAALLARWREKNYSFPYLVDSDQSVARRFGAVCTPDFYLYDSAWCLAYRGRLDDSWRSPASVQRQELREALDSLLAGRAPSGVQNPSMGCSIKWKAQ